MTRVIVKEHSNGRKSMATTKHNVSPEKLALKHIKATSLDYLTQVDIRRITGSTHPCKVPGHTWKVANNDIAEALYELAAF